MRILICLLSLLLLLGCAGMSEKDCQGADWYDLGYQDGHNGLTRDSLQQRRQSCQKYQIAVDRDAYYDGYEAGLDRFCTADNGYRRGREGHRYQNVCPSLLEGDFLAGYQRGRETYERRQHLAEHDRLLHEYNQRLYYLNEDLHLSLAQLRHQDTDTAQKERLRLHVRRLQHRIHLLRTDYRELHWRRNSLERDLHQFERRQLR